MSKAEEHNLSLQVPAIDVLMEERKARGIGLGELEERSGVSVNSVYAWRAGARSPQLHLLIAVADTLGYEIVMRRK